MDAFEKKQIVLQIFEFLDDYYVMYPEEKGNYPDWGRLDLYNEAHPEIFGELTKGKDKILKALADSAYKFYTTAIMN